jgi:hypothetical protein
MNYFELDKYNLDEEWINQPKYYYEAATKLAHKRAEYERAKADHELTIADLAKRIRTTPSAYNVEKITENSVKEAITTNIHEFQKSLHALIDLAEEVDVFEVEVKTLDHRKKALENEVQLFLAAYYSNPKLPKESETMKQVERDRGFRRNRKEN